MEELQERGASQEEPRLGANSAQLGVGLQRHCQDTELLEDVMLAVPRPATSNRRRCLGQYIKGVQVLQCNAACWVTDVRSMASSMALQETLLPLFQLLGTAEGDKDQRSAMRVNSSFLTEAEQELITVGN